MRQGLACSRSFGSVRISPPAPSRRGTRGNTESWNSAWLSPVPSGLTCGPGLLAANALRWAPRSRAERVVREPYDAAAYPMFHEAVVTDVAVEALSRDNHAGAAYTNTGPVKVSQTEQGAAINAAIDEGPASRSWIRSRLARGGSRTRARWRPSIGCRPARRRG